MTTTLLTHVKVQLALHELRPGTGRPLLLLHGLGERTPSRFGRARERGAERPEPAGLVEGGAGDRGVGVGEAAEQPGVERAAHQAVGLQAA